MIMMISITAMFLCIHDGIDDCVIRDIHDGREDEFYSVMSTVYTWCMWDCFGAGEKILKSGFILLFHFFLKPGSRSLRGIWDSGLEQISKLNEAWFFNCLWIIYESSKHLFDFVVIFQHYLIIFEPQMRTAFFTWNICQSISIGTVPGTLLLVSGVDEMPLN